MVHDRCSKLDEPPFAGKSIQADELIDDINTHPPIFRTVKEGAVFIRDPCRNA